MSTYLALLRGINVGGVVLRMDRARELWAELGFENVRTYVQSGNIIFSSVASPSDVAGCNRTEACRRDAQIGFRDRENSCGLEKGY